MVHELISDQARVNFIVCLKVWVDLLIWSTVFVVIMKVEWISSNELGNIRNNDDNDDNDSANDTDFDRNIEEEIAVVFHGWDTYGRGLERTIYWYLLCRILRELMPWLQIDSRSRSKIFFPRLKSKFKSKFLSRDFDCLPFLQQLKSWEWHAVFKSSFLPLIQGFWPGFRCRWIKWWFRHTFWLKVLNLVRSE